MSDINVSVQTTPILVNACVQNPIDITVAEMGSQGIPGPQGNDGGSAGSVNLSGYITTGQSDIRYYPLSGNPSGYLSSANLSQYLTGFNSGQYLTGFNSGQYLTGFNSGQYITGFNSGQYYLFSNPNNYATSGNLQNTGVNLLNIISNYTGYNNTNPSGYITGINTGNFISASQTGQFYPISNPQNYSTSGNVQNTGSTLYQYITNTSGNLSSRLTETGNLLLGLITAASAGVSSLNGASGSLNITGQGNVTVISGGVGLIQISGDTSLLYPYSNPNNYANSGNLQNTGTNLLTIMNNFSGVFNDSGAQYQSQINTLTTNLALTGISLKSTNNLISGNLIVTGINLGSKIDSLSGFVKNTSISITGFSPVFTGVIGISGLGNITVLTGINNTILISGAASQVATNNSDGINLSGNLTTTGQILYSYITSLSGAEDTKISNINNLTGSLYPYNNPSNFSTSGNLQNTGINLQGSINIISGNIITTGQTLNNIINSLSGYINSNFLDSGQIDNRFVNVTGNETISGIKTFTNNDTVTIVNGDMVQLGTIRNSSNQLFFDVENLDVQDGDGYLSIGPFERVLYRTGDIYSLDWESRILYDSDILGPTAPISLDWKNKFLSGDWRVIGTLRVSGQTVATGRSINNYVSSISVTGFNAQTGNIKISGLGNITTFTGINNFIYISGSSISANADHGDGINLSGNLTTTGQVLFNYINNFSGVFNNSGTLLQSQINNISNNTGDYFTGAGFGTSGFIPRFTQDGSGLVNSNIIDSGNKIQFNIQNQELNSGVFFADVSGVTLNNDMGIHLTKSNNTISLRTLDGFGLDFRQNNSTKASLNNGGNLNLTSVSINGDTFLARQSAGVFEINNGTVNNLRNLRLNNLYSTGVISITGNVAINNASPIASLDVSGSIMAGPITGSIVTASNSLIIGTTSAPGRPLSFASRGVIDPTGDGKWDLIGNANGAFTMLGFRKSDGTQNYIYSSNTGFGFNAPGMSTVDISGSISIRPVLSSGLSVTLGNNSFYINTGNAISTWVLPTAASNPGRFYFLKNKAGSVILTGASNTETLFSTNQMLTFTINSGEGYIVSSDAIDQWIIM